MTRRQWVSGALACVAAKADSRPRTTLGVTVDCYQFGRRRQPAYEFAQYCDSIGAGGIQIEIPADLEYARKLRGFLESRGMFLDVMVSFPDRDTESFDRHMRAAKEAGAVSVRAACLGGRRYEVFNSLDQWKTFVAASKAKIERALPIAEKYGIPIGMENHKDWTADELVALLKQFSSENLGVCLDTGNNVALLDDYLDVVNKLAPYTLNTHLKDMGVAEYGAGLLLIEPVLGGGYFDLRKIVSTIRAARPQARLTLEMITRNPLKVPVFTEKYWASFPDRNGATLARAVASARAHAWREKLPEIEQLPRDERLRVEDGNVIRCLDYAISHLALAAS